MELAVRPFKFDEAHYVVDYFRNSDPEFLRNMGADHNLFLPRNQWIEFIQSEFNKPFETKNYFYVLWLEDGIPVGHCNINHIKFGIEGFMHLHLWPAEKRKSGLGLELVKKSITFYFDLFKLENLICECNAYNPAPNATLPKAGFEFIKTYETKPGPINPYQQINRYKMSKACFYKIQNKKPPN